MTIATTAILHQSSLDSANLANLMMAGDGQPEDLEALLARFLVSIIALRALCGC